MSRTAAATRAAPDARALLATVPEELGPPGVVLPAATPGGMLQPLPVQQRVMLTPGMDVYDMTFVLQPLQPTTVDK